MSSPPRGSAAVVVAALVAAMALLAAPAAAQTESSPEARAEALYNAAGARIEGGNPEEAIPLLEESVRLKPTGLGARYSLADCYERTGQLDRARSLFQSVAEDAAAAGKAPLEADARARIARLPPAIPGPAIPPAQPRTPAVEQPVAPAALAPAGAAVGAAPTWSTQRTVGLVVGGAGLAGLAVGAAFGFETFSTSNEVKRMHLCKEGTPTVCTLQGRMLYQAANETAVISNVAFSIGSAAVIAGVVTFLTARVGKGARPAALRFDAAPTVGGSGAGVLVHGVW